MNNPLRPRQRLFRRLRVLGAAAVLAALLGGCAGPGHPGWCYWHPYRCH